MLLLPAVASGQPTLNQIHHCDSLVLLKALPDNSVNCIVTSPPYYALRDYGVDGQIGLEDTPQQFIARLVAVFREARRVLRADGTCWVNMGDSYNSNGTTSEKRAETSTIGMSKKLASQYSGSFKKVVQWLPPKSLMMIPARLAIAMQDDGWILRSEIVWSKPNPMPESVTDRPTKAHEMIYMFAKSERYFYDNLAVKERTSGGSHGSPNINAGKKQHALGRALEKTSLGRFDPKITIYRNLRDVWHVSSEPQQNEHYAAYPSNLVETPVKAGCPVGGIVLDFFMGSGTTALVARKLGRNYIGCDLNRDYVEMARLRLQNSDPFQDRILSNQTKQLSLFASMTT